MQKINILRKYRYLFIILISGALAVTFSSFASPDSTVVENTAVAHENATESHVEHEKFNAGEMIFEHILDAHDWHLWGEGESAVSIPLPVIVYAPGRGFSVFRSSNFVHGHFAHKGYQLFKKEGEKKYTIVAVNELEHIKVEKTTMNDEVTASLWDLSITKNVAAIMISGFLLLFIMITVAKAYVTRKDMAPKGLQSLIEPLIILIRDDVAKPSIGKKYEKFMPYLLTVFFFI